MGSIVCGFAVGRIVLTVAARRLGLLLEERTPGLEEGSIFTEGQLLRGLVGPPVGTEVGLCEVGRDVGIFTVGRDVGFFDAGRDVGFFTVGRNEGLFKEFQVVVGFADVEYPVGTAVVEGGTSDPLGRFKKAFLNLVKLTYSKGNNHSSRFSKVNAIYCGGWFTDPSPVTGSQPTAAL